MIKTFSSSKSYVNRENNFKGPHTGDVLLKEFDIHYESDTLGSSEEYEK